MQSAPSEASQNATSVNENFDSIYATQHGETRNFQQLSGSSSHIESAREQDESLFEEEVSRAPGGNERGRTNDNRRLNHRNESSESGSPGSRIDEYEKAHSKSRTASDGMMFQVIASTKTRKGLLSILDFPNEVLTHVLSQLPPETLSSMSLVSRQFHKLVTTSTPWRIAFSYFFPGSGLLSSKDIIGIGRTEDVELSQRRSFTRLSALASWRSEYILRTRLLHSLSRGRPALQGQMTYGASKRSSGAAVITYRSGLTYPVSHIHATFGTGLNKKQPLLIHGAAEQGVVSVSDPIAAVFGSWGIGDFEEFRHFADAYVGEIEYGLGPGNMVGMPNVMDVSQPYGKIYGEACPRGRLYYTAASEQRGRFLSIISTADHELGIPQVDPNDCAVCSVWIAKSDAILKASNGLIGCLAGFSNGVLASYALGVNPVQDRRLEKGEPTARWVLSPGVPIIAISVDDKISGRRLGSSRIWAVVLNALGEVFYLTGHLSRPDFRGKASVGDLDRLAWQTGRSVEWTLIEGTRRAAKSDPFNTASVDGSYTPRTSSNAQDLSIEQIMAETKEVEKYLIRKPKHFRACCEGWDMRRRLVVDFAGDDAHGAGEAIFLITCGLDEGTSASISRFTRCRTPIPTSPSLDSWPGLETRQNSDSMFQRPHISKDGSKISASPQSGLRSRTSSHEQVTDTSSIIAWRLSHFSFADMRNIQISAFATDDSEFATICSNEDPLLGMSGESNSSSPVTSPNGSMNRRSSPREIPGQRARFCAAGTTSGIVILWDMRSAFSLEHDVVSVVSPIRIIYTKSPQISSIALTALYVVHGGNDGLVQAWDPLASTEEPIRTLNSRFSDRARRRIAQAEASVHGVGNNFYAAGAIILDPDPTILRGVVSLGTHLRYWSYSSTTADVYRSKKRGRLRRRSERSSNSAAAEQKVSATARGLLKDYIASERLALERDEATRHKEVERMSGRFGIDLLGAGASEEEILAYATMLSEETWTNDEIKRKASEESSTIASPAGKGVTAANSVKPEDFDADLEEAIRLSLLKEEKLPTISSATDLPSIPIRQGKASKHSGSRRKAVAEAEKSSQTDHSIEDEDLNFALQMSIAEQQSMSTRDDLFPALPTTPTLEMDQPVDGKGKARKR